MTQIKALETRARLASGEPIGRKEAHALAASLTLDPVPGSDEILDWLEAEGIQRPELQSKLWTKEREGDIAADDFDSEYLNPTFARQLAAVLRLQSGRVRSRLSDIGQLVLELVDRILPDREVDRWVGEVADVARTNIGGVLSENGQRSMAEVIRAARRQRPAGVGVEISFDLQNRRAQTYLGNASRRIGRQATDTFRDQLRHELIQGIDAGESTKQIARRIRGIDEHFVPHKAETIARTETAFASINGTEQGWQQSGVVSGKKFVLAPGACPWCQAVAAEIGDGYSDQSRVFRLGQPLFDVGKEIVARFPLADGTMKERRMVLDYAPDPDQGLTVPPVHPRCRCSTRPVLMD